MKFQITASKEPNTLRLAGELDLYSVETACEALLDHLARQPGLELDLSGVEACDTAGLQLLLAVRRSAAAASKSFAIHTPSPAIEQCGELLGLSLESLAPHAI